MRIGVYGYTDKRPVIYSLIKALQATGDVAVISSNRHYKRLLEFGETQGHMANVMIVVSDATPDEIFEEVGYTADDFEHVIFDIQETIPDHLDLTIHVKSYAPSEEEQSFLELLGEHRTIKLAYDGKREKGSIHVIPSALIWKAVELIETCQVLHPIPSKELNQGLALMLAPYLKMKPKMAYSLLTRRWGR
ncbi:hypothetical protein [Cohnella fermenti]|uniref:Uncharacterized protein n=1 Tax=Cohnella fermenti TaxID=2565925 RepID=A0A4S4BJD3_9BACL|nr:hypothetical protein [Cohnella fermenti]THF74755.1 hypothetical protein E6C55_24415 [Cohnella fermenti]